MLLQDLAPSSTLGSEGMMRFTDLELACFYMFRVGDQSRSVCGPMFCFLRLTHIARNHLARTTRSLFRQHFVRTDASQGLDSDAADALIKVLNDESDED